MLILNITKTKVDKILIIAGIQFVKELLLLKLVEIGSIKALLSSQEHPQLMMYQIRIAVHQSPIVDGNFVIDLHVH